MWGKQNALRNPIVSSKRWRKLCACLNFNDSFGTGYCTILTQKHLLQHDLRSSRRQFYSFCRQTSLPYYLHKTTTFLSAARLLILAIDSNNQTTIVDKIIWAGIFHEYLVKGNDIRVWIAPTHCISRFCNFIVCLPTSQLSTYCPHLFPYTIIMS